MLDWSDELILLSGYGYGYEPSYKVGKMSMLADETFQNFVFVESSNHRIAVEVSDGEETPFADVFEEFRLSYSE